MGAFASGVNLHLYPFGEDIFIVFSGGFQYLGGEFNGVSFESAQTHSFKIDPLLGAFDVGIGYRF
jgi:hypothetical protein